MKPLVSRLLLAVLLVAEAVFLCLLACWSGGGKEWQFAAAGLLAGGAYAVAAWAFVGSAREKRWTFWLAAVGFRLIVLAAAPADDLWRYLWEGRIQLQGFNPYVFAPDSPVLAHLRDAIVWPQVNHRDYAAIYPPLVEKLFAGLAALGAGPLAHKLLYGAADLGACAVVLRMVGGAHVRAAWYAWNPLAIYEFTGAGHFDSLMLLALVGSAALLMSSRVNSPADMDRSRLGAGALLLGLAVALKIVPAVLFPVWALALGWRRSLLWLLPAAAILPASALLYGWPTVPVFATLKNFAYVTRLNDAVWWLFESLIWTNPAQKNGVYQGAIFAACLATAFVFRQNPPRAILWTLGAALLLSPALHPWYVAWILPFAAWRGTATARAWFVLSVTLFGYYVLPALNPVPDVPWREPLWLRFAIFGPALLALFAWRRTPRGASVPV